MSDNTSNPRSIERSLDQTRSRLDSHLSELQDRLSPGQVLDDLMSYFRGSEGADFGRNLLESVRSNPMPAAVTGIGLAWLMASKGGAGMGAAPVAPPPSANTGMVRVYSPAHVFADGGHDATAARVAEAERGVARQQGEADHAYDTRLAAARGQALGLAQHAQETAGAFGKRVGDVLAASQQALTDGAHGLSDMAGGAASSIAGMAQGATRTIGDAAQRAGGALSQGVQATGQAGGGFAAAVTANPVLLGAIGLAAGALLGALLPQSDQEEAALGKIAGQARGTARDLAQTVVDKGSSVAHTVLATGQDSAGSHGLTGGRSPGELVDAAMSGSLAQDARQVVTDVLHAGDTAVRKEALGQEESGPKPAP